MRVGKEITDRCPDAVLHPIKMDSCLDKYRSDPDVGCTVIYKIIATRERLTVADYMEYVPLKIAAVKADLAHWGCIWDIEYADEDFADGERDKPLSNQEEIKLRAESEKHLKDYNELERKIAEILRRGKYNLPPGVHSQGERDFAGGQASGRT